MFVNKHKHFKVALIADELTAACLRCEFGIRNLTPLNYRWVLRFWKPDYLLVESAWNGYRNAWKFGIAAYPDYPERSNQKLAHLVAYARDLGIPCVFWNKEDGVHFNRFIESAKLFDHIFTVDENCIPRYRSVVAPNVTVNTLMFPVQPVNHHFTGFNFKYHRANFVGSYSHHVHDRRRSWQDLMFGAASTTGLGLTVIDRNSDRRSPNYRFPSAPGLEVRQALRHDRTAQIYKDYLVSLNVNTIEDSATMYSRRLVEILACGGIAVTNPNPAVDRYFKDFCHVVHGVDEAVDLFDRLKHGPASDDFARAEAGAQYVLAEHTWAHRIADVARVVGL
ncbi:glycosyltransferase [Comamonas thiooxydans]|uniref:Glycosyltransferase n=1 Tax=Comamonas thiooxydans TaxID=363952 RepID=A0AA42Q321_9BURK|nr:glycosyltransferase [Comamonas thiooxydans]MDH1336343.1 glycosyltransferase [Comamonas thiooxydans]MDH1742160.1 glycosyltransferase [Comamonas thiooxydans]MDH1788804.1 glycosyltransferase [Comamonas thiooxydans]